ncbi:MAG: YbaK/EbsC family protein [Actinobacteria bacterium]|nr:YbaK/EbsC family protein [Actinomycetota bacterium]
MSPHVASGDSAERVRRYLEARSLADGIRHLGRATGTAQSAAEAVGCELGRIAKSVLFVADGEPVLAVLAGDRMGDADAIGMLTGAIEVRLADAGTVRAATGYEVGSVSPFDLPEGLAVLVDESLSRYDTVLPAAGTAASVVRIPLDRLVEITGGRVARISR